MGTVRGFVDDGGGVLPPGRRVHCGLLPMAETVGAGSRGGGEENGCPRAGGPASDPLGEVRGTDQALSGGRGTGVAQWRAGPRARGAGSSVRCGDPGRGGSGRSSAPCSWDPARGGRSSAWTAVSRLGGRSAWKRARFHGRRPAAMPRPGTERRALGDAAWQDSRAVGVASPAFGLLREHSPGACRTCRSVGSGTATGMPAG